MLDTAMVSGALVPDARPATAELAMLDESHARAVDDAAARLQALAPDLPLDALRRDAVAAEPWTGKVGADHAFDLPGYESLDELVARQPMAGGRLVLSRGADPVDPGLVLAPTRGRPGAPSLVNPARLRAVLGEGVTAQLAFVDEIEPGLGALCLDLERVFPGRAKADLFLSQGTTSGLGPHFDDAELLVVQLAGTKQWRLHPPDEVSPRRGYVDEGRALQEGRRHPAEDVVLDEGELLFVPQGWWHEPAPVGGRSVHVTLAISRPAAGEVLEQLARWGRHHVDGVRAPVGDEWSHEHLAAILAEVDVDAVDRWRRWLRGTLPARPDASLSALWDLGDSVGLDDATVRGTAPGGPVPVASSEIGAVVWMGGREIRLDPGWLAPLAVIADGRRHAVADLPVPDGQTTAWPLVTTLATDGLVSLGLGA